MPPTVTSAQAAPPAPPATTRRDSTKAPSSAQESPSSHSNGLEEIAPQHGHQKLVFTDPVALRYLEEDPSTIVLHRRLVLQGYEVYIVEQWACSRIHPTFVITTYTGDPKHTVSVGVLSVPTDESTWSPRLKLYFNAVTQYQARKKETPLGTVMVTDLSSFPSALTVIPVPEGDVTRHKEDFVVNENLKRLSCAGRAGLKLQHPSPATVAKFYQLYRTSERVPVYSAVIELVKQCQIALTMFGILPPEYVDGLLCDVTENAIREWWTDIGIDLYNIEPGDGVLGPTTVAALLGTYMGARNRLHAYGAPVGKDAFDTRNLKRAIESFQKSQKMERTRRLDRQTLDRLHRATAKAANAEGWTDAVKSTMAELSGHGGEMVMGMVRGREKGGIADIETLELDNFASLVFGERAKWLWRGKPRKAGVGDGFFSHDPSAADMMFMKNDQGYVWTSRKRHSHEDLGADRSAQGADRAWKQSEMTSGFDEKDQNLGRMVRKGVSGKVSDARIGFGRFKEAVGLPSLRSQHHRQAKDCVEMCNDAAYMPQADSDAEVPVCKAEREGNLSDRESLRDHHDRSQIDRAEAEPSATLGPSTTSELKPPEITIQSPGEGDEDESERKPWTSPSEEDDGPLARCRTQSSDAPASQDELRISDMLLLRRPQSCLELRSAEESEHRSNGWPRHLSFSVVEEVVLGWKELASREALQEKPGATLEEGVAFEDMMASDAHILSSRIEELAQRTAPWVERQVLAVDELSQNLSESQDQINALYLTQTEKYQQIRDRTSDLLTEEHTSLLDTMKRVELMGAKLDYELSALESKVEDVETGLGEFERYVLDLEARIQGLIRTEEEKHSNSWFSRLRSLFGAPSQ
ncbi:putative Sin3 complex subunit (Stb2) [Aspergillus clavatus NRRL 1]|uniref:Sin3 complex subunit (Stb2), putative n=1 Tax=Aspergillus clavatus (strain ATCC 1007 / CBS 513.65 / DSM 816 / NCTC 3887 / NRRL 1 / QM 1276 / 107) TaxID=344612 RepID=A1CRL4_ASPCL|nr:Sin3 complex subunit (Stb2), putative [Aspergillus clavatus NRRL 1]EAW08285.1 Sin3 complex subunit (Stb2), putative [Aspergillus clavatus NRRL 1]